ncbi:MAG: pyridoxal phosphate-dependent aminotransferase [Vulcanimicrobiota bacterium]
MTKTSTNKKDFLAERTRIVKSSGIRKAFDMVESMKDVIHLGIGEPDFEAPEELKMLMKMAVDEGYSHYTPNAGYPDLRDVIAEKLKTENNLDYDPKTEVMATVGAMNAIHLAILCLIGPGDEAIIQNPAFVGFEPCIQMAGGRAVHVQLREEFEFRLQAEDVEKSITENTKLLIVNSPQNPTGSVLRGEDLKKIAEIAKKHNLFVISDEAYEKLVYDGIKHISIASLPGMKERTLTVMSFSKTYSICGWRIGFAAGPPGLLTNMIKFQQFDAVHPAAPVQKAAMFYLKRSQEYVEYMKKIYVSRRDYMVERLNQIGGVSCVKPEGAFYLFLNIKKLGIKSEEFSKYLLEEFRIVTIPGSALGKYGEGYIRICLTVPTEQLQIAAMRIEQAVQRLNIIKK